MFIHVGFVQLPPSTSSYNKNHSEEIMQKTEKQVDILHTGKKLSFVAI